MSESKRGRVPRSTYVHTISVKLMHDWMKLNQCELLTQLDIVQLLCEHNPRKYPTPGMAVRELLDTAIDQVIEVTLFNPNITVKRIGEYLNGRVMGKSVSFIADEWGLTREYVSRTIGRQAAELVTERVLKMARRKVVVKGADQEPMEPVKEGNFTAKGGQNKSVQLG